MTQICGAPGEDNLLNSKSRELPGSLLGGNPATNRLTHLRVGANRSLLGTTVWGFLFCSCCKVWLIQVLRRGGDGENWPATAPDTDLPEISVSASKFIALAGGKGFLLRASKKLSPLFLKAASTIFQLYTEGSHSPKRAHPQETGPCCHQGGA